MTIRTKSERLYQALAYELGGIALATPAYALVAGSEAAYSLLLVVSVTLAVMVWSPIHNHFFDLVEWRLCARLASDRPPRWRLVHAISHEASDTMVSLPVITFLGNHSFWEALAIDIGFTLFYAIYTYTFHFTYDRWRPVHRSSQKCR